MTTESSPSILRTLRSLIPRRDCTFDEALVVAERQAGRLCQLIAQFDPHADGVDLPQIQALPRIQVVFEPLPVSGMSHWNGQAWVIAIASGDSMPRQRFTLLHEFKHILDHGHADRLYLGSRLRTAAAEAEQAADFFAGCALVPRAGLKRAWGHGLQRAPELAAHFGASEAAVRVRLAQTGLDRVSDDLPAPRCARPISTPIRQPQRFRVTRPNYIDRRFA